ncbi:MAG: DUF6702 family protein [Ferruginibacter sp.]
MGRFLHKWLAALFICIFFTNAWVHPIYVSVTEIEHNAAEKTLEVSCKIFTDDFEKVLRTEYKTPVDLINPKNKAAMDKLVNAYVQQHLKLTIDGKAISMKYLGYEIIEEGVYSYYEATGITQVKNISIFNNLLYKHTIEQMGLMHVTVGGNRKSTKLNNPESIAILNF